MPARKRRRFSTKSSATTVSRCGCSPPICGSTVMPGVPQKGCSAGNSSAVAARPGLSSPGTSAFSPDGDGASETLTWQARAFTETIALSLALSRGRSELRALIVPVSGPGDYALTWDGTDNAGRVVDSGVYRYDLTAINRAGVASAAVSGYVDLQSAVRMLGVRRRY